MSIKSRSDGIQPNNFPGIICLKKKEINPLEALKQEVSLKSNEGKVLQPNSPKEISIEEISIMTAKNLP